MQVGSVDFACFLPNLAQKMLCKAETMSFMIVRGVEAGGPDVTASRTSLPYPAVNRWGSWPRMVALEAVASC